jgi:PAS domain S-box-containing protein
MTAVQTGFPARDEGVDQQLRCQADSLSAVLAASVDHIYVLDKTGRYRYVSLGGANVVGLEPAEMIGKHWRDLGLPAEIMQPFDAQRQRAIETGEPHRHEVVFRDHLGADHYYEYNIAPVRGRDGQIDGVVVISRDNTERKRTEDALRETDAILRSFYDTVPVMMGVVEVTGDDIRQLTCNTAACHFFGVAAGSLAGRSAREMGASPEYLAHWIAHYQESERTGQPVRFEYQHPTPGGPRWLSAIAYCIERLSADCSRCSYVAEDITERKRVEAALLEADRRKDEFLATLAHELRNPLAPLRNSLQILKMPRVDAATAERSREVMERQVQHLMRLVDDLLDVSRAMRGKVELCKQPVELAAIVGRAVETAQPLIDAQRHHLDISLPDDALLIDADAVRLSQAVCNLLTNAAKYTEAGGHIRLSAWQEGGTAVLTVRDDGIGIAPDVLPHIFELFVQADHSTTKAQGGLGIGLTLVRNLVEMHGGTVEAHSAGLGQGTEMIVRLPLCSEKLLRSTEPSSEGPPKAAEPAAGHRLMIVDDNKDGALSLAVLLQLRGHEVEVAHDGPSALELGKRFRPALIFLDIGMPKMDGFEVARRMRETPGLEKTVLVALTGWGQQGDRRRTAEAGFHHHLVKPLEPGALAKILAGLNEQGPA